MKILAGILLVIAVLLVKSESFKVISVFFFAGSFLSFLSYIVNSSLDGHVAQTTSDKKRATRKLNKSTRRKSRQSEDDSHLIIPAAGVLMAGSLSNSDDDHSISMDDDISSISTSTDDLETTMINPASGLPMISGIGSVDVAGNAFGSDSMSDMHDSLNNNFIDDSSMFSDDLTSSTDSFDSFDSSSSIGCDDSFSSFDDSCSSMNDDW